MRSGVTSANRNFFLFFQLQAIFVVFFSIPFAFITLASESGFGALVWIGILVWAVGNVGTIVSDRQLATWRANPANKGKTARGGLWSWSRHPNYFFEWVNWCGVALVATATPWGWIAWIVPAGLLFLLFRVTGIPATERQALRAALTTPSTSGRRASSFPSRRGEKLVVAPGSPVPIRRRKPSRPRTQGGRIPEGMWPTEDDGMRSVCSRSKGWRTSRSDHYGDGRPIERSCSVVLSGRRMRFSASAFTATRMLDPDIEIAAISGRKVSPHGAKTPAAIGSASEL